MGVEGGGRGGHFLGEEERFEVWLAGFAAEGVDGAAAGDEADEGGFRGEFRVEGCGFFPDFGEDLLDDVFGGGVLDVAAGDAPDEVGVLGDAGVHGAGFAGGDAEEDRVRGGGIGRRGGADGGGGALGGAAEIRLGGAHEIPQPGEWRADRE